MFTQSVPAPAPAPSSTGLHVASSTSPALPASRTSRLRGLSYLRNYTQSHLLNREHSGASNPNNVPSYTNSSASASASASAETAAPVSRIVSHSQASNSHDVNGSRLVRSESYPCRPTHSSVDHIFALPTRDNPLETLSAAEDTGITTAATTAAPTATTATTATSAPTVATATTAALNTVCLMDVTSAPSTNGPAATAIVTATTEGNAGSNVAAGAATLDSLPSIRFSTFYDPRSTRPSLKFATTSRTLPTGKEVIRVGRYSERDSLPTTSPNAPSAAHVGFKSKVVSRRHCEFWFENNRWFIKDVKSSSGTFLNHIRLSQPGTESKPFPVNDGDVVQLGIDFKGGEEMIFRCVKIRIELNRGWQNKLNAFNMNTHKRLRNMTKSSDGDGATQSSQDCSICLNSIAPCQSLFVAPCSHTWHYKCVRSLLDSPQYPGFICPNCRAAVDLEADVEDPPEEWEHGEADDAHEPLPGDSEDAENHVGTLAAAGTLNQSCASQVQPQPSLPPLHAGTADLVADTTIQADPMQVDTSPSPSPAEPLQLRLPLPEDHLSHATVYPMSIPMPSAVGRFASSSTSGPSASGAACLIHTSSPTADAVASHGHDGPITPRNDAGPWVFDGSGIRIADGRPSTDGRGGGMRSLDTAAAELAAQSEN